MCRKKLTCIKNKDVLKARDQKQLDFEELSRYLDQAALEKERILHPKFNDRANIAEYVTDKINEVRGISMQQARREKLSRLETKIKEVRTKKKKKKKTLRNECCL
jgi:sorting nexin-4